MSDSSGLRGVSSRSQAVLFAIAAVAIVIVFLFSLWDLSNGYRAALSDTQDNAENLTRAFASHVERSVSETGRIIDTIVRDVQQLDGNTGAPQSRIRVLLNDRLVAVPQLQGAVIVDSAGYVVAGSLTHRQDPVSVSGRDYFAWHRDNPASAIRVGEPIRSLITGDWFISVTRRIEDSESNFRGIVVAAVSPQYFSDFYESVDLPGSSFVELVNAQNQVLAVSPVEFEAIGSVSKLEQLSPGNAFPVAELGGGFRYLVAEQPVIGLPLSLRIAVDLDAALARWRQLAWVHGAVTVVSAVLLLLLLTVLYHRTRRLQQSEQQARRRAQERDLVLSSIPDAVVAVGADGQVTNFNTAAERLFSGDSLAEPTNPWAENQGIFLPDGSDYFPSTELPLVRAMGGEVVDDLTMLVRNAQVPEGVLLLVSARPVYGNGGEPNGAIAVCRDITEMNATEQRLMQAQKMEVVGQLTGGVAHDFNNLLTVILGTAETLAEASESAELRELADMTVRSAQRGAELTHRLLAFSRQQPLAPEPVAIRQLLDGMQPLLRRVLRESIVIRMDLDDQVGAAYIDPSQLESALLNLSINARDAMPDGGQLTIEARNVWLEENYADRYSDVKPGSYVMIAVSDTGAGIPAAELERVFDPFYTTKPTGKGTGLGLSMVYGFIKQSEGHVSIYSEVGSGTTVKLYLPQTDASPIDWHTAANAPDEELLTANILVVEDDEMVRSHVVRLLTQLGHRVTAAEDGRAALSVLQGEQPVDVLFTDVIMPGGMNGRMLADRARKLRPGIRVLYTSGYTESTIVHHGHLETSIDFLHKPYQRAELQAKLQDLLRRD